MQTPEAENVVLLRFTSHFCGILRFENVSLVTDIVFNKIRKIRAVVSATQQSEHSFIPRVEAKFRSHKCRVKGNFCVREQRRWRQNSLAAIDNQGKVDMMVTVQAAHIRDGRNWWIVIPLAPTFGKCSAAEQQKILASFEASVRNAKKSRMIGVVVIAWRDGHEVHFAAPKSYPGPLPQISWMELFGHLGRQISCDDPLIAAQLINAARG